MAEYPLLVFPEPSHAERARRGRGHGRVRVPDASRQAKRLKPQFQRLLAAMEQKRIALQHSPLGIQPEQVLVLEIVGSIKNFISAIRGIEGLEWLGETELEHVEPDYGFEDELDPEKELKGQLFWVMTDQRALQQLQSLFARWEENQNARFPYGLAKLKEAFVHLRTIRLWGVEDRIRETGLLEDWEFRLQYDQSVVPFEAELWFRGDSSRQEQSESYLRSIIEDLGGEVVQQCVIPAISYHAVLGKIPCAYVQEIVTQRDIRLLQCEGIMHIRPVGQCAVRIPEDTHDSWGLEDPGDTPAGEPIVALFDGLPLTGHRRLSGRLIVDDPDGYESTYQAGERVHGTAMASLVCHGDLNEHGDATRKPLYVRPIMQPKRDLDGILAKETIPENTLPVDLIHRAIRRLFEPENGEPPAAPSVRVINLSICDPARPLYREMSAWARLLDWLSWEYNILVIVSAGNHHFSLELSIPKDSFLNLDDIEHTKAIVKTIAGDTRNRRLLSPAETLNGLTVGAIHADASTPGALPGLIDPYPPLPPETLLPSVPARMPGVYSAHGPGYRRSIKPELLLPGGRQFLSEKLGNTKSSTVLETKNTYSPPGQLVAAPGAQGELDRTRHTRGTSNATALASRGASLLHEVIEQLRHDSAGKLPTEYDAVLIKTLLVHGAEWGTALPLYESVLKNDHNSKLFKEYAGRFLGYGSANIAKVVACTDQRITVLGVGKIEDGNADEFTLPLPPSLSEAHLTRRLTITLAWLTPVKSTRQEYRVAHLWFNPKQQNVIALNRREADHNASQRGTVQHELLEGSEALHFQDGENITVKVNCRADADDIEEPIRYSLAVTLEVLEDIGIPLYQEVRERLAIRVLV